ncbi:MAG: VCBS repeat-containing protein [Saprospiraceae bacterium]|nr:VCBS repeat-containing protein [Saprospiraceae bacterium]
MRTLLLLFITQIATAQIGIGYTKITDANNPVVNFQNNGAQYKGVAWIDFDHDGLTDLFVAPLARFKNLGNGQFLRLTDLTDPNPNSTSPAGCSWGDINNDDHPDCIISLQKSALFLSNAQGDLSISNNLLTDISDFPAWDCSMADANNDGLLDLLFVHAAGFHGPAMVNRFYLQQPGGQFQRLTGWAFTDSLAAYTIPIWADYDLDGDMDLFIGSGPAQNPPGALPDYCFKNLLKETGAFGLERLTQFPFLEKQDGQTYNFVDFDFDGDLDICLTNYSQAPTRFYQNDNGTYVQITTTFTAANGLQHLANCWADVDNDGDLDVVITRDGSTVVLFYRNNGNGTFAGQKVLGLANGTPSGLALADYDRDGDLDVYTNGNTTARTLFRNDTVAGNRKWAQFTLTGVQSNRSAIGAMIRLKATVQGRSVWQFRQVLAHNSFQSQSDLRQHFGLDQSSSIDSVEVRWPSGLIQHFTNLASNQFYTLNEGGDLTPVVATSFPEINFDLVIAPNPARDQVRVSAGLPIRHVEILDSMGRLVSAQCSINQQEATCRFPESTPAGHYVIRLVFENGMETVREIVVSD